MPAHTHALRANTIDPADTSTPGTSATFAPSTGGTLYQAVADTEPGADRTRVRRRQPAAQQHAALPDPQLLHRPAGRLPGPAVTTGSGDGVALRPVVADDSEDLLALYAAGRAEEPRPGRVAAGPAGGLPPDAARRPGAPLPRREPGGEPSTSSRWRGASPGGSRSTGAPTTSAWSTWPCCRRTGAGGSGERCSAGCSSRRPRPGARPASTSRSTTPHGGSTSGSTSAWSRTWASTC
ncbi:hypothetical protein [Nocardioides convexus]|uniref:hypothetical protein n=1 Tax=Nocardioides convexus TaxID=2712224 RepID=UPI002418A9A7|nr:hypothetical protein [Nocardioides convexus]